METTVTKRELLAETLRREAEDILRTIRVYLRKMGLIMGEEQGRELALEVLSETALTVLSPKKVEQYEPVKGSAVVWIKRVSFQKVRGLLRDRSRRFSNRRDPRRASETPVEDTPEVRKLQDSLEGWMTDDDLLSAVNCAEQEEADGETAALASAVLDEAASLRDRQLLELAYLGEYSAEEIGAALNMKSSAIHTALHRARRRISTKTTLEKLKEKR